jgi:hypothetical protein
MKSHLLKVMVKTCPWVTRNVKQGANVLNLGRSGNAVDFIHSNYGKFLPAACIAIFIGILIFGLWPLGYRIPNKAKVMDGGGGVFFEGEGKRYKLEAGGIAYTPSLLSLVPSACAPIGEISLELIVTPSKEFTNGVGSIVIFVDQHHNKRLVFGQWKSSLIIRTYYFPSGRSSRYTEIGMQDALRPGEQSLLAVTSCRYGTVIYLNGKRRIDFPDVSLIPAESALDSLRLFLGNDPDVTAPWAGEIKRLAIYGRVLSADEVSASLRLQPTVEASSGWREGKPVAAYSFRMTASGAVDDESGNGNTLRVPDYFELRQQPLQAFFLTEFDAGDIAINVAGFVPLGTCLFFWMKRWTAYSNKWIGAAAIVAGFVISLGIEWTQSFIPSRCSTVMDVICNTMGTMVGVAGGYGMVKMSSLFSPQRHGEWSGGHM